MKYLLKMSREIRKFGRNPVKKEVVDLETLETLTEQYIVAKKCQRDRIRSFKQEEVGLKYCPPLIGSVPETNLISVERGWRRVPAEILLSIAEGLATGEHWWLRNPRRGGEWRMPKCSSLAEIQDRYLNFWKDGDNYSDWRTNVRFTNQVRFNQASWKKIGWVDPVDYKEKTSKTWGGRKREFKFPPPVRMRWEPFMGGYRSGYNYERFLEIIVSPSTTTGTIRWCTGTGEESSFIGSILVILPGAEDDGIIAENIARADELTARYAKTVFEAKKAGLTGELEVYLPDGKTVYGTADLSQEDKFLLHLGYWERRSWTAEGEERRFAKWLRREELLKMVEVAKPLPYKQK